MGDVEDGPREAADRLFQHFLADHVEVVGGLVQDQEVGAGQHELREGDAAAFAAGQIRDALEDIVPGEQEGGEHAADSGAARRAPDRSRRS